jgi:hypothetical protein
MGIPRDASDKLERSRILFCKGFRLKLSRPRVTKVFVMEFLLHDIPQGFFLGDKVDYHVGQAASDLRVPLGNFVRHFFVAESSFFHVRILEFATPLEPTGSGEDIRLTCAVTSTVLLGSKQGCVRLSMPRWDGRFPECWGLYWVPRLQGTAALQADNERTGGRRAGWRKPCLTWRAPVHSRLLTALNTPACLVRPRLRASPGLCERSPQRGRRSS